MGARTTLILDAESRTAARQLAGRFGCSMSEAIRRAVIMQRDEALGLGRHRKRERKRAFLRLIQLFERHDAAAEVRRLKREDAGF